MHQHMPPADSADVLVVGAGPAGSSTAFHLAQAGLDVLLLEKSVFPREKVCGDGLTPRAVKQLVSMGIPLNAEDGWFPNKGLRIIGGGVRLELGWPEQAELARRIGDAGWTAIRWRNLTLGVVAVHAARRPQ